MFKRVEFPPDKDADACSTCQDMEIGATAQMKAERAGYAKRATIINSSATVVVGQLKTSRWHQINVRIGNHAR